LYTLQKICESAVQRPNAPAIVYNLEPISYRAFYRMIMDMRGSLAARGLPEDGVAVVFIDVILVAWIVDLALRSLGLTTVAIRAAGELEALGGLDIVALVTYAAEPRPGFEPALAPGAARIAVERADWTAAEEEALAQPPEAPGGGHILLTSGTTGRPKMILIDAAYEAANRDPTRDMYRAVEGVLQVADPSTGMINLLNFGLWTGAGYSSAIRFWDSGGAVIIHQGADATRSLGVAGATHLVATPAFITQLLAAPAEAFGRNDAMQVITAGGTLSLSLARQLKARLTRRVATGLGATETGSWAMTPVETDEDLRWHRLHPTRLIEVVDEADQPLPPGRLGQVRVRLDNGLTGYLNDPEATAQFFRGGYFYPGDLGVLDGQGRLALMGRVTEVLNVLGDKIPAQPFEQALRDALGIEGVCVLNEPGPGNAEALHVVLETATPIDEATLRTAARAHLGGFPDAHFHFVSELPRNHMGKIERFKLKQRLIEQRRG
jgi:acyl-coenzyme A synthetase/AMP-(fatty) acid ligase